MDWYFLIIIVLSLAMVYLIFKLVKKVVYAIITVVVIMLVVSGILVGMLYVDYNYLASQENFDIKIMMYENETPILGVDIPVEDQEPQFTNVSGMTYEDMNEIELLAINSESGLFVVTMSKEYYDSLLKSEYDLSDFFQGGFDIQGVEMDNEINYKISKAEFEQILYADEPTKVYLDMFFEKNPELVNVKDVIYDQLLTSINDGLAQQGLTMKHAMFLLGIQKGIADNPKAGIEVIKAYQDEDINIYPSRFSFKLLKIAPVSMVEGMMPDLQTNESEIAQITE